MFVLLFEYKSVKIILAETENKIWFLYGYLLNPSCNIENFNRFFSVRMLLESKGVERQFDLSVSAFDTDKVFVTLLYKINRTLILAGQW
jgi:hypothetical protein